MQTNCILDQDVNKVTVYIFYMCKQMDCVDFYI